MIARDIGMEVKPELLDSIVIGIVRRQEMKLNPPLVRLDGFLRDPTGVNRVVVGDQMDPLGLGMFLRQMADELNEQKAILMVGLDPLDLARLCVEGPCQIPLGIDPGRLHGLLPSGKHPVRADLGIQIDVHLIFPERLLIVRKCVDELLNLPQSPLAALFAPGANHEGTRASPPSAQMLQDASHGFPAQPDARLPARLPGEQLQGPSGPCPSIVGWPMLQQLVEHDVAHLVHLGVAIVTAAIDQSGLGDLFIPDRHSPRRRMDPRCFVWVAASARWIS